MSEGHGLSDVDLDLIEVAALQVPWYMLCGEFHRRFASPGALAVRLFELARRGLLVVRPCGVGAPPPTPDALEHDALENACYVDLEGTHDPIWEIVATERGIALVRDRLDPE